MGLERDPLRMVNLRQSEKQEMNKQCRKHQRRLQEDLIAAVRPALVDMLEIGAPVDSALKQAMESEGGTVFSMGLWNKFDFDRRGIVTKAKEYVEVNRPRRVHISPPCTPFSILQKMSQRNPEQKEQLRKQITWGTKVINYMIEVGIYALGLGCELSFEHPANASS